MYGIPFYQLTNIIQLTVLDEHFNRILMLFYAIVKSTAPFFRRTYAKVSLGHFTVLRIAISKKKKKLLFEGCGEIGNLVNCWWECKIVQPLWKKIR